MSREMLNDEVMNDVVGGKITFDWDGATGHCGLNGDKSYTFTNNQRFLEYAFKCYQQGMSDAACLQGMVDEGIIW